jgi:hypothetical protein
MVKRNGHISWLRPTGRAAPGWQAGCLIVAVNLMLCGKIYADAFGDGIVHGALMGLHDDIPLLCIAACRYRIRQRSSSCRRRHA